MSEAVVKTILAVIGIIIFLLLHEWIQSIFNSTNGAYEDLGRYALM